jgi:hypothetical protein
MWGLCVVAYSHAERYGQQLSLLVQLVSCSGVVKVRAIERHACDCS